MMPCSRRWGLERRETCAFSGLEFELKLFRIESNVEGPILDSSVDKEFPPMAMLPPAYVPYATDVLDHSRDCMRCIMDRFP